jgi:non-heme chloroperoxidase
MRARSLTLACLSVMACLGQSGSNSRQNRLKWRDPSPHIISFISIDPNVTLEVLDWGGAGRPIVLLAGLGNTAHVFDDFAPKLTDTYHVYGITRRGFGASSSPAFGYSADRLGEDVLAVLDALRLKRPVLVGHSIAGEELSSIATRYPEKISGLIYLEAGYAYAYYDPLLGDFDLDYQELQRKLKPLQSTAGLKMSVGELQAKLAQFDAAEIPKEKSRLLRRLLQMNFPKCESDLQRLQDSIEQRQSGEPSQNKTALIEELLQTSLPAVERDLQDMQEYLRTAPEPSSELFPTAADLANFAALGGWIKRVEGVAPPEAELRQLYSSRPNGRVKERDTQKAADAIAAGQQKYKDIHSPILAIYSLPQDKVDSAHEEAQAKAFEKGISSAHVVRVPHGNHYVFLSNENDVLREMRAFLDNLP